MSILSIYVSSSSMYKSNNVGVWGHSLSTIDVEPYFTICISVDLYFCIDCDINHFWSLLWCSGTPKCWRRSQSLSHGTMSKKNYQQNMNRDIELQWKLQITNTSCLIKVCCKNVVQSRSTFSHTCLFSCSGCFQLCSSANRFFFLLKGSDRACQRLCLALWACNFPRWFFCWIWVSLK